MPSHNMVSRRAYSSDSNTRLWSDNLTLLNSGGFGSATVARSPPIKAKLLRRREETRQRALRQSAKNKDPRQKHTQRRGEKNSGQADMTFLESGGLGPFRTVQSNVPWTRQDENPFQAEPGHFSKKGVRRIQDNQSAPMFELSRHVELDSMKKNDLVSAENDAQDVQFEREESLEHFQKSRNNAMGQQAEPSRRIGERSATRTAGDLTKLGQNGLAKQEIKQKMSNPEKLEQKKPNQEKPKQKMSKQEESRKEQPQSPPDAEEQALLRAVWQHGAEKVPLPKHLETIRRKYKMDSLNYRYYWRYVAGSMMTPRIPGAYDKARNFLRRLEKGKGNKHVVLTEGGEQNFSYHLRLMIEAKKLRKENEDRERKGESRITDIDSSATVAAKAEQKQNMTYRQKWRLNKEWAGIQMKRRAIIEERVSRLAEKQMRVANAVQELERQRKIRKRLSEREADVKYRIQNLLETLAIDEDKQREAKEAREEAHRLAEEREERREGLDHVLDDALTIAGLREGIADITSTRDAINPPALLSKFYLDVSHQSPASKGPPTGKAKQDRHDGLEQPTPPQGATASVAHAEALSGQAGPGDIFIDPSLTLKLNADTKTLQRQIQKLEGRLSASYPRMDAMPYVISLSENRNTLQTWLRILGKRLKSRDDNADEWSEEKTEVKAVLDQMVRDHDLNNEAARRMAKRWEDIVQKRAGALDEVDDGGELEMEEVEAAEEVRLAARGAELDVTKKNAEETVLGTEVDEELDMEEFDAGGMSFLNADEVEEDVGVAFVGSDVPPETEVPLAAQNTELDVETAENVAEAIPSTEVEEEFEPVAMDAAIEEEANVNAQRKSFPAGQGAKAAANPLITPNRKQNDMVDDFIAKRLYSTSSRPPLDPSLTPSTSTSTSTTESYPSTSPTNSTTPSSSPSKPHLPHLTTSGSAHMVSVSAKAHTVRTAIAVGTVHFSNPTPLSLISSASLKKGDVLAVSRIAGIMAAKKCPDLIPLCHPIPLTHVGVELRVLDASATGTFNAQSASTASGGEFGAITIEAKVQCTGPTGVEMEALIAVMGAALSVVDMCKAVDKFQRVMDVRVVLKEGGKSGVWREEEWRSCIDES